MPRGGPRPGAGAPADNLNALKHGRRSEQLRQLFVALSRRGVHATLERVIAAAAIARAGLVKRRKAHHQADQAGHQNPQEDPPSPTKLTGSGS